MKIGDAPSNTKLPDLLPLRQASAWTTWSPFPIVLAPKTSRTYVLLLYILLLYHRVDFLCTVFFSGTISSLIVLLWLPRYFVRRTRISFHPKYLTSSMPAIFERWWQPRRGSSSGGKQHFRQNNKMVEAQDPTFSIRLRKVEQPTWQSIVQ